MSHDAIHQVALYVKIRYLSSFHCNLIVYCLHSLGFCGVFFGSVPGPEQISNPFKVNVSIFVQHLKVLNSDLVIIKDLALDFLCRGIESAFVCILGKAGRRDQDSKETQQPIHTLYYILICEAGFCPRGSALVRENAYLLVPEKKQTRKIPLKKITFFVGRARENDLIIPSESLSRFHAQINHRKSGDFSVTDRGSLNGVYVNGTRIYSETMLKDGDIIGFGDHHVRFCIEETKPLVEKEKSSEKIQRFSFTSLVDSQRFEPEKRQRYLELLYQFSARLLQQFPSSDLGNVALDLVQEVWSPDRACLMMHSESNEWQIINQRFGKNPELTGDSLQISSSVIRELESNEEALLIPNRLEK